MKIQSLQIYYQNVSKLNSWRSTTLPSSQGAVLSIINCSKLVILVLKNIQSTTYLSSQFLLLSIQGQINMVKRVIIKFDLLICLLTFSIALRMCLHPWKRNKLIGNILVMHHIIVLEMRQAGNKPCLRISSRRSTMYLAKLREIYKKLYPFMLIWN